MTAPGEGPGWPVVAGALEAGQVGAADRSSEPGGAVGERAALGDRSAIMPWPRSSRQ